MAESKSVDHGSSTSSIDLTLNRHSSSLSKLLRNVMLGNPPSHAFQGGLKMDETGGRWALEGQSESSIAMVDSMPGTLEPFSMIHRVAPRLVLNQRNSEHDSGNLPPRVVQTPNSDGYHWRKYGQKQMKPSHSSRGYYKCAHFGCNAKKKIRQCDQSGRVIDIVYINDHNHGHSQKNSRELVASPDHGHAVDRLIEKPDNLDGSRCLSGVRQSSQLSSSSSKQPFRSTGSGSQQHSICVDGNAEAAEENVNEPCARASDGVDSVTFLKAVKEPTFVVHGSSDEGISSDGYRWRKYGQKMMKRNSLWRSYYRCTAEGCPVRKHVERATLDAENITVIYQAEHNHDQPILKKHYVPESPPTPPLSAAGHPRKKIKRTPTQPSRSKSKSSDDIEIDMMSEKILELGGEEEALELARILLSFKAEVK